MTLIGSSLQNKLVLFATLLVLVPGLVVGVIAERSGRESLQAIIGAQLAREASHIAEQLGALLRAEQETLRSIAAQGVMREIRVDDIDKRISRALSTLREGSGVRRAYLALDAAGRVVAASDPLLIGPPPTWLPEDVRTGSPTRTVQGPLRIPTSEREVLLLATATPDPDDATRTIGSLVAMLDWHAVTKMTRDLAAELRGQGIRADVLVADAAGRWVGGSGPALHGPGSPRRFDAPDAHYRIDESGGYIIGSSGPAGGTDFRLLVVQPIGDALRPAQELSRRIAMAVGLALVLALLAATAAARRVIRPLSELTDTIRHLPRTRPGRLRVPVRTSDEVGELGAAFNEVAQELDRVQRELVEAERYSAVGEFASGVAHHVRTSLGVLRSSAQMLERATGPAGERERELAQMIRSEVDRLAEVVNDLLHLGRRRERDHKPGLLSEPVSRAASLVRAGAEEKGALISFRGIDHEPLVDCDADSLYQACVNLLVNAVEVAGPGVHVSLELYRCADGWMGIEVRDDGPGIPEAIREQIFDPFVTGRHGGVGLGLTFVQRVVREHSGRIEVAANEPRGTVFRIELPVVEEA